MKSPKQKRITLLALAVLLVTVACVCTGSDGIGDLIPSSGSTDPDGPAYFDDFSNPLSGWPQYSGADGINDYASNGYRILVDETEYFSWSIINESFTDASIEVQVVSMTGPFDGEAGIVCRYQDDNNFYFLTITKDGFYAIGKITDGEFATISGGGDYQESSAINQSGVNSLRADCIGSTLTFYANGTQVGSVTDSDHASGDVGLIAGTFSEAGADIQFDDFAVYNP